MTRADALDRRFGIALAASLVVHAAATCRVISATNTYDVTTWMVLNMA